MAAAGVVAVAVAVWARVVVEAMGGEVESVAMATGVRGIAGRVRVIQWMGLALVPVLARVRERVEVTRGGVEGGAVMVGARGKVTTEMVVVMPAGG